MDYHAGQAIVYEGHVPYGVHLFIKGKVGCYLQESGRRLFLKSVPLFFPVGCDLILSDKPYDYTLIAEQDVSAYFFSRILLNQCFALA